MPKKSWKKVKLKPVQYSVGFTIDREIYEADRTYGPYRRNGKVFYRNYHRRIAHGLTTFDLMKQLAEAARKTRDLYVVKSLQSEGH